MAFSEVSDIILLIQSINALHFAEIGVQHKLFYSYQTL